MTGPDIADEKTWAVTVENHEAAEGVPAYTMWEIWDTATNLVILDGNADPDAAATLNRIVNDHNNPPTPVWVKPYVDRLVADLSRATGALQQIAALAENAGSTLHAPYVLTPFDLGHIDRDLRGITSILAEFGASRGTQP
jgi:hypothetical protein